jgi:hypothetical protein
VKVVQFIRTKMESASFRARSTWFLLVCLIGYGTSLRLQGLTSGGLWRDDAWVVLSSRVGIGTAWHMWVTAPGFYLMERTWILLHPGSSEWDQIPPLVIGIAGIPAMFWVARLYGVKRPASILATFIVCVSPICVTYSSRLKEYGVDFLMACLVLGVAEAARRHPDRRRFALVAAASVCSFAASASILPVLAAVWLALAIGTWRTRKNFRLFIVAGITTALSCVVIAAIFYRNLSPALHKFWQPFYVNYRSPVSFLASSLRIEKSLATYLTGTEYNSEKLQDLVFVVLALLVLVGIFQAKAMLVPALVVACAFAAAAFSIIPLGTGRTDEALYPAILILTASGLQKIGQVVAARIAGVRWTGKMHIVLGTVTVVIAIALLANANAVGAHYDRYFRTDRYPTEDTQALAARVYRHLHPGDEIVASETMRYPWALYEDTNLRIVFNRRWATGFSIANTQPHVFIATSEYYESGSDSPSWIKKMDSYKRLWFLEAPPLSFSPLYTSLRKAGWHPVATLNATGCKALLLVRSVR